jgi:hypothetical protein
MFFTLVIIIVGVFVLNSSLLVVEGFKRITNLLLELLEQEARKQHSGKIMAGKGLR